MGGSLQERLVTIQVPQTYLAEFDKFVAECRERYGVRVSRSEAFGLLVREARG